MEKMSMKMAAGILGILLVTGIAIAQPHRGGPGGEMGFFGGRELGFFTDYLDLTEAQQTQAKAIMEKEKPSFQPLMEQMRQSHHDLMQLEQSGSFDEAKVRDLATKQASVMTELTVQKARVGSELYQLLTADQKAKLAKLAARHEQRFQDHGNSDTGQ